MECLENKLNEELDLQSTGLHRNTEGTSTSKNYSKLPKRLRNEFNLEHNVRKNPVEPLLSEREYDICHVTNIYSSLKASPIEIN